MHNRPKAATFWQLTFSVIILSTFFACQDPGTIGGGFVEKTDINIDTLSVSTISVSNQNAYLGRLGRSAVGNYEDDLFGTIETYSFFKPAISRSSNTIVLDDTTTYTLRLQLLENDIYGDTTQVNNYTIHRVTSLWRGSAFQNNMDIFFDQGETIGQFSDADADTNGFIEVDLTGSWSDEYPSFFNEPDSVRDENYRLNEYGLVIIPEAGSNNIRYINYSLSSLKANTPDTLSIGILDWGYDVDRTGEVTSSDRINLHSTLNNIFKFNLSLIGDEVEDINFVRAELVFNHDTLSINNMPEGEVRSTILGLGLSIGPLEDVAYELAFGAIDLSAAARADGTYRFNITGLLNDYIHGTRDISDLYIYASANQGALAYTSLFFGDSDPSVSPRIIIYGLESGAENE